MNEAFLGRVTLGGDARGYDGGVREKLAAGMNGTTETVRAQLARVAMAAFAKTLAEE
jgi:hypothetical protein